MLMWKKFLQIDIVRYPEDLIETNYSENKYLDKCRDLTNFHKHYKGESIINPFLKYLERKAFNSLQVFGLRFQKEECDTEQNETF